MQHYPNLTKSINDPENAPKLLVGTKKDVTNGGINS